MPMFCTQIMEKGPVGGELKFKFDSYKLRVPEVL